jgi:hypothetical protein
MNMGTYNNDVNLVWKMPNLTVNRNTGSATAMIDPLIQIDPSWPYADKFFLEFSEGFGPAPYAVPEPTTMLLLGSGLIGLAGYGRKKFFKK